jgi:hypothetical protein
MRPLDFVGSGAGDVDGAVASFGFALLFLQ